MPVVKVALPIPRHQYFEYLAAQTIPPGCRVRVPFGPRRLIGVVIHCATQGQWQQDKLKQVEQQLDSQPIFTALQLSLCQWLAQYYMHPLGDVLQSAMPVALRKGHSAQPAPIEWLQVSAAGEQYNAQALRRAPRQQSLLKQLQQQSRTRAEVRAQFSQAIVKALLDKGLIASVERAATEDLSWSKRLTVGDKPQPNIEQAVAISNITAHLHHFTTLLLEGVTGSGKTEVYLQSIEPVLKQGKQVLILVPEIGLTPQTVHRFKHRFGLEVGVLHSNLTDNERLLVWHQSRTGQLPIVIGTRSAIFTPMLNPGMLIVDEEHDGSYKQQDGLRYHARDFAVMRARQENIPLLLGSATPSLESLNNALSQRYQHLQLQHRAGSAAHAQQNVLDVRDQPLHFGIASGMIAKIRSHLQQGSQVLLFINRRGFAPAVICHCCGHVESCHSCDRPFTMHKQLSKIQCHHCGAARAIPQQCSQCHSRELVAMGLGTEQLQQGLASMFPDYASIRIDSDTARGKSRLNEMLDKVNSNQYQLLVGTQILSKGHHFPNVTLVLILDADGALFSADYRAAENLAQLLTQLAGRAGRAEKPGEMWLQTYHPGHPLLQDLINNGYGHFARYALLERQQANLPPYSFQALIRAESVSASSAHQFLAACAGLFMQQPGLLVLGPVPAIMEKRQGRFRMQLLLQSKQRKCLHHAMAGCLAELQSLPLVNKVRWSIDVDPQDFS